MIGSTRPDRGVLPTRPDTGTSRYPLALISATSFLTAATFRYAIGAGITAAAGTRLALRLILVKITTLFSFQFRSRLRPRIVIFRHYIVHRTVCNLRACCLPWMW